jgi:hypothetical protein
VRLRVDDLVGDRHPEEVEHVRQHDHTGDQDQEDHDRMRHLVADPLDHVEDLLHSPFGRFCNISHVQLPFTLVVLGFPAPADREAARRSAEETAVV